MADESEHPTNGVRQNGDINGLKTGKCVLCSKISVCKCERCNDFYCSPMCQRKDWPNHRYICFPLPRLVKADEVSEDSSPPVLKVEINSRKNINGPMSRKLEQKVSTSIPMPKSGSCVFLCGFKSTNRCYIRSTNPSDVEDYNNILEKIDNFGKTAEELSVTPKSNTFALTQKSDKWCRVQVLSARGDSRVRVLFMDYGAISVRSHRELRKITDTICKLPCYSQLVQLNGVTNVSVEAAFMKNLNPYINKEYKIQIVESDKKFTTIVDLYHWDSNILLNNEILNICADSGKKDNEIFSNSSSISNNDNDLQRTNGEQKLKSPLLLKKEEAESLIIIDSMDNLNTSENSKSEISMGAIKKTRHPPAPRQLQQIQKPCLEPPFDTISLTENDRNVSVIVVDSTYVGRGYIGCLLQKYADNLKLITEFLSNYNFSDQPYKPKLNEYCIAQFDNLWYRAKVIEILGEDKYQVVYIDFSNELELTSESIRRYPMSLTLPCCTSLCAIEGLPEELSDKLIERLEKEFDSFPKLPIDRVKIEEGITFIQPKELIKTLHESKLI